MYHDWNFVDHLNNFWFDSLFVQHPGTFHIDIVTVWSQCGQTYFSLACVKVGWSWSRGTTGTRSQINTLRPRQNGPHFADDIFKCIFVNENVWFLLEVSLNFVPKIRKLAKPHKQSPPQAISSKPGCRGCHCDIVQHVMFELCICVWVP